MVNKTVTPNQSQNLVKTVTKTVTVTNHCLKLNVTNRNKTVTPNYVTITQIRNSNTHPVRGVTLRITDYVTDYIFI